MVEIPSTGIFGFVTACLVDPHWLTGHIGPTVVESAGEVSRMTLTSNTLITTAAILRNISCYHCPSVRNTSKAGGSHRDQARYSQSYLRSVSQGPLQRLRTDAPPFYTIGPWLLRRYIANPALWCHRFPRTLSFEDGALFEPLSVPLASVEVERAWVTCR